MCPTRSRPIRYHSIPPSCAGAANTLADARASYRADLTGLLHVGKRELPPVTEHVETVVHGMLVREKVGAVHRDHAADRMFLQTLLADGQAQDELRAYLDRACGAGVEPVVVLAEPQDTVGSVLDQMTPTRHGRGRLLRIPTAMWAGRRSTARRPKMSRMSWMFRG